MADGVELATAYVTVKADGRRVPAESAALGLQSGKAFGKGFSKSTLTTERALDRIGKVSKRTFLVGAAGIAFAEKKAADFNAEMATVYTLSHANTRQQALLAKSAKTVGVNIGYSATKSAQAQEELIKAGVSLRDILGGGLKGALDLAAAGQTDVASATEVAASAMTQFKLKGRDVPHIADLLAAGADKALGSVTDLGYGLSQVGTTAHQMNLSIEDTVGTLAEFAQNGLTGERGGTTFKMMLLKLANPTDKAAGLMDKYNLSIYKANGQMKSMPQIAGQLQRSFKDLAPAQRNAALGTIFGSRAIQAANILIKEGEAGNRKWIKSVNDQGFAAHQAAGKMDSLKGDAAKLNAELENAFINASGKQSFLRVLAQDATGALKAYNRLSDAQREVISKTAVKVVAGAGLIWAATKVYKLAKSTSEVYGAMFKTRAASTALDALGGSKGLGKAGVVPVFVTNMGKGLPGSPLTAPAPGGGGSKIPGVIPWWSKAGSKVPDLTKTWPAFQEAAASRAALSALGGLASLTTGSMVALGGGSKQLSPGQTRGGVLPSWLPGSFGQKKGPKLLSPDMLTDADIAQLTKAQRAMLGLRDTTKGSSKWWDEFSGGVKRAVVDTGKYAEVAKGIPKEVRSYLSTPGAKESTVEMQRLAKQYHLTPKQITTSMKLQGYTALQTRIVAAKKSFTSLPKQVKTALRADTVKSVGDVKRLQRQYNLTPKQVQTVMHVSGVDAAIAKTRALQASIAAIRSKSVTIDAVIRRRGAAAGTTVPGAFAGGGYTGAGRKYEPAGIVHRKEFVFSAEATEGNVAMLSNLHRQLRGYSRGGLVGRVTPTSGAAGGLPRSMTLVVGDREFTAYVEEVADERVYAIGSLPR